MSFPYKVTVKSTGKDDVNIKIEPQPIATKEEYIKVVAGRFQRIITDSGIRNTLRGRAKLKDELVEVLKDYHSQGLIKPKED